MNELHVPFKVGESGEQRRAEEAEMLQLLWLAGCFYQCLRDRYSILLSPGTVASLGSLLEIKRVSSSTKLMMRPIPVMPKIMGTEIKERHELQSKMQQRQQTKGKKGYLAHIGWCINCWPKWGQPDEHQLQTQLAHPYIVPLFRD